MQALEAHSEGVASAAESIHRTATQSTMDRYARSLEEERMLVDGAKRSVAALESEAAAHRRQQEVMACCFRPPVSTREYPIPAMVCCFRPPAVVCSGGVWMLRWVMNLVSHSSQQTTPLSWTADEPV